MTPDERPLFKAALGATGECPSPELLAAKASDPEVQRHLESCAHCRTELAMLQEFEAAEPRPDELASVQWIESELSRRAAAAAPQPASLWERIRAWASFPQHRGAFSIAFASLLVVVAAGWYLRYESGTQRLPSPGGVEIMRSGRVVAISPVGDVGKAPSEFRWEAVAGAATYQIRLMEVDGTVIWSSDSVGTSVAPGRDIRGKLTPGRAFNWVVIARNAAGERIASSDLQNFHITATSR